MMIHADGRWGFVAKCFLVDRTDEVTNKTKMIGNRGTATQPIKPSRGIQSCMRYRKSTGSVVASIEFTKRCLCMCLIVKIESAGIALPLLPHSGQVDNPLDIGRLVTS